MIIHNLACMGKIIKLKLKKSKYIPKPENLTIAKIVLFFKSQLQQILLTKLKPIKI